jgi:hypothetical protein
VHGGGAERRPSRNAGLRASHALAEHARRAMCLRPHSPKHEQQLSKLGHGLVVESRTVCVLFDEAAGFLWSSRDRRVNTV